MKFEIICGINNNYNKDLDFEIKNIISKYPHKLKITDDFRGRTYQVQSESHTFANMKLEVMSRGLSYLLYSLKHSFYTEKLKQLLTLNLNFILSRVMIFSEFDREKQSLLNLLIDQNIIVLDGVCNFMVKDMKSEWQRACNVLNLSMVELRDKNNFKEFIQSMSGTILSKYNLLYLFCGLKNTVLSDKLESIPSTILSCEKLSSEEKVISTLIENYPMNVAIYEEAKSPVLDEALEILFDCRKNGKSQKSI